MMSMTVKIALWAVYALSTLCWFIAVRYDPEGMTEREIKRRKLLLILIGIVNIATLAIILISVIVAGRMPSLSEIFKSKAY